VRLASEPGVEAQRAVHHRTVRLEAAHQAQRREQGSLDLGDHPLGQDETGAVDPPGRLEHRRAGPVAALHDLGIAGWPQREAAPLLAGDQRGEHGLTVEVRQAHPDDLAAFVDQGRGAGVAEHPETPEGRGVARHVARS
jgi:hypothetical protein